MRERILNAVLVAVLGAVLIVLTPFYLLWIWYGERADRRGQRRQP